ncbi:DDT domain-containing protein PTM [Amborella trichopoda]|uniref:PHD-type domain-containing protein n=1 Tax=Amborella trichopoda TaxID=13333 RepID=W1PYZ1_AMBTC|nr:DDT domain-containing protein PTM [Amborella trichopoda]ERN13226.1 hypothetical protein AMTR_s00040p00227330 [Amborella trichopoda]|eukprot:XP_006851759.1 DDT domain-containing protein PTM [Amborella trichopoda]
MESDNCKTVNPGRQRRVMGVSDLGNKKSDVTEVKWKLGKKGRALVGRYVKKDFAACGAFLGKIVAYYGGFYRVRYEDEDGEDLEYHELCDIIVQEENFDAELFNRKRKLDQLIVSCVEAASKHPNTRSSRNSLPGNGINEVPKPSHSNSAIVAEDGIANKSSEVVQSNPSNERGGHLAEHGVLKDAGWSNLLELEMDGHGARFAKEEANSSIASAHHLGHGLHGGVTHRPKSAASCLSGEVDSSSDSSDSQHCYHTREPFSQIDAPPSLPLILPPSSDSLAIPEELVPDLLYVYSFLRSFSHQLFLSPFVLDDFVGSLKCMHSSTLFDAVHFSLLRTLKRHLEMLSKEGFELAAKCLRQLDWTFLDSLTWPNYLMGYLMVMGSSNRVGTKLNIGCLLDSDYYGIPLPMKICILRILCDDVLESEELRAEVSTRVRLDPDVEFFDEQECRDLFANGPTILHPRHSKWSAFEREESQKRLVEPNDSRDNKILMPDMSGTVAASDLNSDECRLCGMDGSLICCDGCPSAYHSRCIGLSKADLPRGSWFCPECAVDKVEPMLSKIGKGLRGAEVFGVDPYGHIFCGTGSYLLVSDTTCSSSRYYKQDDIPKVLQAIDMSTVHSSFYSEICMRIRQYWEISEGLSLLNPSSADTLEEKPRDVKDDAVRTSSPCTVLVEDNRKSLNEVGEMACVNSVTESIAACQTPQFKENAGNESDMKISLPYMVGTVDFAEKEQCSVDACERSMKKEKDGHFGFVIPIPIVQSVQVSVEGYQQCGAGSIISSRSLSPCVTENGKILAEKSVVSKVATSACRREENCVKEDADGSNLHVKDTNFILSNGNGRVQHSNGGKNKSEPVFNFQAYENQYILGDVAASAAANLAVCEAEGCRTFSASVFSDPKKLHNARVSLQVRAFSGATMHFHWPYSEKKFMEVVKEKCGWCISCQSPNANKKVCLLSSAATSAMRGAVKIPYSIRVMGSEEGYLSSVIAYILHMEEGLLGLVAGPWARPSYRRQWRKHVEQVSSCKELKLLLLELEENIRPISLSGGWFKLVDEYVLEISATQMGAVLVKSNSKRGYIGRRKKKQSAMLSDIPHVQQESRTQRESKTTFYWWRGGKLSKQLLLRGILPSSIAKKAARQGGFKKVFTVSYSESVGIPRRSFRFAWRAAVERSRNASHLALRVRVLNAHIRWMDLVPQEQFSMEVKKNDADAGAFRKASIVFKKAGTNDVRYLLEFNGLTCIPERLMKYVIKDETCNVGNKAWFSENHIPLYLTKKFEERLALSLEIKPSKIPMKIQRRLINSPRGNAFEYLTYGAEMVYKCLCVQCQKPVPNSEAVKCGTCQGSCHKECMVSSTFYLGDEPKLRVTCIQCHSNWCAVRTVGHKMKLKAREPLQGVEQFDLQSPEAMNQNGYRVTESLSKKRRITDSLSKKRHNTDPPSKIMRKRSATAFGVIWKGNESQSGESFRANRILLRSNGGVDPLQCPVCILCCEPYNPDLMYIKCEACDRWYHGDALEVLEAQIFDIVGFRCCKCRKKSSPICPYTSPEKLAPRLKRMGKTVLKATNGSDTVVALSEDALDASPDRLSSRLKRQAKKAPKETNRSDLVVALPEDTLQHMVGEPTPPLLQGYYGTDAGLLADDDPLLFSLSKVVPITECETSDDSIQLHTSGPLYQSPKKLPVRRRHAKQENNCDDVLAKPVDEEAYTPQAEWDLAPTATAGLRDSGIVQETQYLQYTGGSVENMELEPQTFFSFTEMLESEDDRVEDFVDMSIGAPSVWVDPTQPQSSEAGDLYGSEGS